MSHRKEMTSRERLVTAARRKTPDRIPRIIEFERQVETELKAKFSTQDVRRHFKVDMTFAFCNPTRLKTDFSRYFTNPSATWDAWGAGRLWDSTQHYAEYLYPMERLETEAELAAYPWPDMMEPYRFTGLKERVADLHSQGWAVFGAMGNTIFETAWQLRSMDSLFEDMLINEPLGDFLLDRIMERRIVQAREYALAGVDALHLADDLAMQDRLMVSPELFNSWLAPRYARIIAAAREINPDILIHFHSDGKMDDLMPHLLAVGVDIFNPIQPECMDHKEMKRLYGDRCSFSGGLGVQSVLPHGTPEEVTEHVRTTIETLGAGGGLIVGPAHIIERDIPYANFIAMVEAIDQFGRY